MKKFTVRDFIAYNNPCFSCGNAINFTIGSVEVDPKMAAAGIAYDTGVAYLNPVVKQDHTEIELLITYTDSIKLFIFHKTNKIKTNNLQGLTKYLDGHKLFLRSYCYKCQTVIESHYLDFDLKQSFVMAGTISFEDLRVDDKDKGYRILSYFSQDKSILIITKPLQYLLDKSIQTRKETAVELSLLPKYRFKNREQFLEKIKLYTLFS